MDFNTILDSDGTPPAVHIHRHPRLLTLPNELYAPILLHLRNRDIKSVRLTCKFLHSIAHLRLHRVFLSANPRNIQVLRDIADSDTFRQGVTELIWDDARLKGAQSQFQTEQFQDFDDEEWAADELEDLPPGCPSWFGRECRENVEELESRKGMDSDRPEHAARAQQLAAEPTLAENWAHYQKLLQQQEAVIGSNLDEHAFRYALERFPALRRITITPAAHGWLFTPLYETPMIRALPCGFNYPIPRGWPTAGIGQPPPRALSWGGAAPGDDSEEYKNGWRGVRIALRVLAEGLVTDPSASTSTPPPQHNITELVFDAHHLSTGLNCHIFDDNSPTNTDYSHLSTILRRPGFSRLDLALLVGGQEQEQWSSFLSGHLHRTLSGAPDLTHISLQTNVAKNPDARAMVRGSGGNINHHVPLRRIFPIQGWNRLTHFGLSGFLVRQDDLLELLSALPATLRSVELSFLYFLDNSGDYRALLEDMRDSLSWRDRNEPDRPRVVIGHELLNPSCGRAVWVDHEVDDFLYSDGPNPFGREDGWAPNQIWMGRAGREKDAFDPSHERPYADNVSLMKMGFLETPSWMKDTGRSEAVTH